MLPHLNFQAILGKSESDNVTSSLSSSCLKKKKKKAKLLGSGLLSQLSHLFPSCVLMFFKFLEAPKSLGDSVAVLILIQ